MVCAAASLIATLPSRSTATPAGCCSDASTPADVETLRPAKTLTAPSGVTFQITEFTESAMKKFPLPSRVMLETPKALPASKNVVTTPCGVNFPDGGAVADEDVPCRIADQGAGAREASGRTGAVDRRR